MGRNHGAQAGMAATIRGRAERPEGKVFGVIILVRQALDRQGVVNGEVDSVARAVTDAERDDCRVAVDEAVAHVDHGHSYT